LVTLLPSSTFVSEIQNRIAMDKADFTFLVTSFLYMVLAIVERLGLLPDILILDFAFAFLWGILFITTGVKVKFYLQTTTRTVSVIGVVMALLIFILSIVLIFINH